ncbi:MAG: SBBP repeat-containing protein, partial [Flavobacteriales bacterium]
MKKQLLMLGLAVGSVFSTKAQSADIQWAKGFGATGTGIDNAASIAIDDAGNVYTAGLFTGTTDLDPGPGTFSVSASGAEREIYIQKLNANGDFAWGATFQNTQSKYPSKITVDPSGNVILVGRFRGTMDFDPGPGTANRTAVGLSGIPGSNDDAFIVKLDTDGNYMWATSMGQFNTDLASYVTTDAAGNIYTTGIYRNNVDFNPGSGTNVLTNNGGANIFIQKLSPNGDYIWARGYGGTSTDHGKAVVVDANQNVYLAATISSDNWAFDSNNLANSSHSVQGNGSDVVVLKLNQAGNFLWSSQVGGNSSEDVWGIALDNLEKPVITGTFSGSGDFNPGSGTFTLSTSGSTDAYTLKLNTSGDFEWATKIGGTSDDVGRGIATDAAGNSYTTGYFRVAADFDPGAGTDNRTSAGNREIFVQKLDTDGNYVWAKTIGGTGDDYGIALDHNAAGALVIAGFFSGTVDFEDGSGVTNLTSNGGRDAYVVKYFECAPETATDVITACGSYQWINGTTYTSDNNSAQVTLTNQAGCDSVVTLDLTISQPEATTDVITACGSYEWINGTTYTSDNNLAQVTLTNQAGCDSVVTLD